MLITARARRAVVAPSIRRTAALSASLQQRPRPRQLPFHQHALFSSLSSADADPGLGPDNNPWKELGLVYSWTRKATLMARLLRNWRQFGQFDAQEGFARDATDDVRCRIFLLAHLPRETPVDLFEFMTGATNAVNTVYEQLYVDQLVAKEDNATITTVSDQPEVDQRLQQLATDHVVSVLTRKTRHPDLVLKQLEVTNTELVQVKYETKLLSDAEATQRGFKEDEWMRMKVAYQVLEHLTAKEANEDDDDDANKKLIETLFTWTFEANVSDPEQVEWKIVEATDFDEKQVDAKSME